MVEQNYKQIAIIPARGGSKRIPRKNIIDFHGKPMIAWTIEAALESGVFDRVIVSTDDEEIAAISREWCAEVPFTRDILSDDHSTVSDVVIDAIQRLGLRDGGVAMLMANCPLRSATDIKKLLRNFQQNESDFQISAFEYGSANPWWAHLTTLDGQTEPLHPEELKKRSQDLGELLCPTGAVWLAKVEALLSSGTFYGPGYRFAKMGRVAATDIDDEEDLFFARALYEVAKMRSP